MRSKGVLLTILLAASTTIFDAAGRDILLTPNEVLQVKGKSIFYEPSINGSVNVGIPWEETLKHVTYITLFTEPNGKSDFSDIKRYQEFVRSPFIRTQWEYPKFGDIITIARGWLEKSNGYRFIEGGCEPYCNQEVIALWRVQKIRHRDEKRQFRYELKFSITPLGGDTIKSQNAAIKERYFRSFIMKDDDYPYSFSTLTRKSDNFESQSNRQSRVLNDLSNSRNELLSHIPQLNIGEIRKHIPVASSKVGYTSSKTLPYPIATTYRPKFFREYNKSGALEELDVPKTIVTHHFHHHYFMKDNNIPIHKSDGLITGNFEAIRIVEAPNAELLDPRYAVTPQSGTYATSTTSQPLPTMHNIQPIPVYNQRFPSANVQNKDANPFKQSEQHFDAIRYSEPDPLYESKSTSKDSSDSIPPILYSQIERPSSSEYNASGLTGTKLNSSHDDQIVQASYIEKEQNLTIFSTIAPLTTITTEMLLPSIKRIHLSENKFPRTTPMPRIQSGHHSMVKKRSTTEQPIFEWKPKQISKRKNTDENDSLITTTQNFTEDTLIAVTPSDIVTTEYEILTQRSVSKSISVKVGNSSKETPVAVLEEEILSSKFINSYQT